MTANGNFNPSGHHVRWGTLSEAQSATSGRYFFGWGQLILNESGSDQSTSVTGCIVDLKPLLSDPQEVSPGISSGELSSGEA